MTIKRKRFTLGVELSPADLTAEDLSREGELAYDSSDDRLKYRNKEDFSVQEDSTADTLTLTNHAFLSDDKVVYNSTEYFIINPTQNTFQLSDTSGGAAIDITTDNIASITVKKTREVVDKTTTQTLENKTIDATVATGNNSLSADSVDIVYDDTNEAVSSLGTNVQAALDAVKVALDSQNEASEIETDNSGNSLTALNVQTSLDEVAGRLDTVETDTSTAQTTIDDHLADAVDAHDASAISSVPSGNLAATDVQTALDELQSDIDTRVVDGGTFTSGSVITPTQLDVKQDTEANLVTYASTASDGQIVFATDSQKMFQIIDNELQPIGGGGSTQFEIEQVAHGFSVGNGIYHNGTSFVLAQADDANTLAYQVVIAVVDADNFIAADFGRVEVPSHGFTIGNYYFLSDSVAGQPTDVEPSSFSNPLFYVETADILQIKCLRPEQVGADTNLDDLSDVSVSLASEGDVIKYDGAVWQSEKQDELVISLVAAETIAARDALYINGSGEAGLLDADDDNKIEFIGFARAAATIGNAVEVVTAGKLGGFSGLTAGEFVYIDPLNPGKLVQPEPTQSNVYLIKAGKAISATEILVNPDLAASALFNRDVVADTTIANNQTTPQPISGVIYDGATFRAATIAYSIYRRTDSNEVAEVGQLRIAYKTDAGTWSISNDFSGDDAGVDFSIDATGQLLYTSTDLTGANYSSDLKIQTRQLFEV